MKKLKQLAFLLALIGTCSQQAIAMPGPGVDTEADLSRVSQLLEQKH